MLPKSTYHIEPLLLNAFIFIFAVIVTGFSCGQILSRIMPSKADVIITLFTNIPLRFIIPLSVCLAIWQLEINSWVLLSLPVIGSSVFFYGFLLGLFLCKLLHLNRQQTGVYATTGGFINIGVLGSLVVFAFLGEAGLALVPLFKLFEEFVYFSIFFPFAQRRSPLKHLARYSALKNPVVLITLAAIIVGFTANITGIERPAWAYTAQSFVLPFGTFILMVAIGMSFRVSSIVAQWRLGLLLVVVKQVSTPLLVLAVFYGFGMEQLLDGLLMKVCFVLAAMPTAFIAILPATLYKLDQDLANASWFISSVVFLVMLPIVWFALGWL